VPQSFLTEGEQASLWKSENMRALPTMSVRRISVGDRGSQQQPAGLEMEDVQALSPKLVAATLTLMRSAQFSSLPSVDVVKFCTLTPDPVAFEQYPRVAEYVDFGNDFVLPLYFVAELARQEIRSVAGQSILC
jgi:hypothetical protein